MFTKSIIPNILHMCLHRDHHLDLHHMPIKHPLPISDTRLSLNTTLIDFTIYFASLYSKVPHHVSPLSCSFLIVPTSQSHQPITYCLTSKSSHSCWYHARAPHLLIPPSLKIPILIHLTQF